jgi:hypothetical protein
MLKEKTKELENAKKSHREVQSLADRHYNEQREKMSFLEGQIEALKVGLTGKTEVDPEAQKEFEKDWAKRVNEDPAAALEYYRNMAAELREQVRAEVRDLVKQQEGKIQELDPTYRAYKPEIDALIDKYKVSRDVAINIFNDFKGKKVKQPGSTPAPGRTNEGSAGIQSNVQPTGDNISLSSFDEEVLRVAGIAPKGLKSIRRNVALDIG